MKICPIALNIIKVHSHFYMIIIYLQNGKSGKIVSNPVTLIVVILIKKVNKTILDIYFII